MPNAVELSLKDGLRSLGAQFQLGAHWLVQDLGPRLARQAGPMGTGGRIGKLHGLVDSAARQTLLKLESAQQRAATTVLDDAPLRTLHFQLLPLTAYLDSGDARNPSGLFAEVFYWLLRHTLTLQPSSNHWLVHQRAVDSTYWQLNDTRGAHVAQLGTGLAAPAQAAHDHARLCARLLQVLLSTHPVRDATVPPWVPHAQDAATTPELVRVVLGVVLAVGSVRPEHADENNAADCLRLGSQIARARHTAFTSALRHPAASAALSDEFAFVFRHIHPC
jgi:hypothetical protein